MVEPATGVVVSVVGYRTADGLVAPGIEMVG